MMSCSSDSFSQVSYRKHECAKGAVKHTGANKQHLTPLTHSCYGSHHETLRHLAMCLLTRQPMTCTRDSSAAKSILWWSLTDAECVCMWDMRRGKRCSYTRLVLKYWPQKVMVSPVRQRANCCDEHPQPWETSRSWHEGCSPGLGWLQGYQRGAGGPSGSCSFCPYITICSSCAAEQEFVTKWLSEREFVTKRLSEVELAKTWFCLQCCSIYLFSLATQSTRSADPLLLSTPHAPLPPWPHWNKKLASCLIKYP